MTKPLLVLGAGGHASVLVDILRQQQREIIGIVSPEIDLDVNIFGGIKHFSSDEDVLGFDKSEVNLVNGIGSMPGSNLRSRLYEHFNNLGYNFETIIANSATISHYSELGKGVQVMHGAIVQVNAKIGNNSIINSGAIVEHDCKIGMNNHIAPGATLSGQVSTNENVHVGSGAVVIQMITIGKNVVIGAGAIVNMNIEKNNILYPAKGTIKNI